MEMEPPKAQDISRSYAAGVDVQDKVINKCCSCCYDCTESCLDYLFCNLC